MFQDHNKLIGMILTEEEDLIENHKQHVNEIINIEGSTVIQDPSALNTTELSLSDPKSPGVFISNIRAFSSDNNPWTNVGSALSTKVVKFLLKNFIFIIIFLSVEFQQNLQQEMQ